MKRYASLDYAGPVGEGPGKWEVEIFKPTALARMQSVFDGRDPGPGSFHVLLHDKRLWMSDSDAEKRDHSEPDYKMSLFLDVNGNGPKVLIHGLGLGLVVAAALRYGSDVDVFWWGG